MSNEEVVHRHNFRFKHNLWFCPYCDKHCDNRLFFNKLTSWLIKCAFSWGEGVATPNSTYFNVCSWEENSKRVIHFTFRDLHLCKRASRPFRLHVRIMHCLRAISSPGMRKAKNIFVHKLAGFKNNVHSRTPKEYCSKPMHQLCKLRFVVLMQAELTVKWNAFQAQTYTSTCSSFNTKAVHWF